MSTSSMGAIVGTYVSVLVLLSVLASVGSIVTYIIIVVANRAEPDPTGNRTSAVYHVGTAFIALWLEIAGVITIFVTLFNLCPSVSITRNFETRGCRGSALQRTLTPVP